MEPITISRFVLFIVFHTQGQFIGPSMHMLDDVVFVGPEASVDDVSLLRDKYRIFSSYHDHCRNVSLFIIRCDIQL